MPSRSFYLGPRASRLLAESWDEVVAAAAAGVLDETQWVELKEAVPPTSKPANLELAKDLASLSVDGGVLVIGISDADGKAGPVVGTDLAGLQSRIPQVATGRISPPLALTMDVFHHPEGAGVGLLIVTVPASEGAPHMVDNVYWGRDAHGKRILSDHEVRRLLEDRRHRAVGFDDRLRTVVSRLDPPGLGERGRMYVLLEPGASANDPVSDLLVGQHMLQVIVSALGFQPKWHPSFHSLTIPIPRPDGLGAASMANDAAHESPQDFLALLLADDGSVLISAPAARQRGRADDAPEVVSPGQVLEALHSAVVLAGHVATIYTAYQGTWRAGLFVTRLRGLLPSQAYDEMSYRRFTPYPAEEYSQTTMSTTREMAEDTAAVVARLAKGLLRGLSVADRFLPYEHPRDLGQRSSLESPQRRFWS